MFIITYLCLGLTLAIVSGDSPLSFIPELTEESNSRIDKFIEDKDSIVRTDMSEVWTHQISGDDRYSEEEKMNCSLFKAQILEEELNLNKEMEQALMKLNNNPDSSSKNEKRFAMAYLLVKIMEMDVTSSLTKTTEFARRNIDESKSNTTSSSKTCYGDILTKYLIYRDKRFTQYKDLRNDFKNLYDEGLYHKEYAKLLSKHKRYKVFSAELSDYINHLIKFVDRRAVWLKK